MSKGCWASQLRCAAQAAFVLASDICYAKVNLGPPLVLPGTTSVFDSLGIIEALAAYLTSSMKKEHRSGKFGHDPDQYRELTKAPDGFYE